MSSARLIPFSLLIITVLLLGACGLFGGSNSVESATPAAAATQQSLLMEATPTPQPTEPPLSLGPAEEDFLPRYNPLTGQPVLDPSLLNLPAVLLSISHFPAAARPQAGLSFAPMVFEIYITEGATRFLAVLYGGFPHQEASLTGGCEVRSEPFVKTDDTLLGNQVWFDQNANGTQDPGERGIGGVCIKLHSPDGSTLDETATDSNGFYGFNVQAGGSYQVEFVKPGGMEFTQMNVGDEERDSDADPATGLTPALSPTSDTLDWDAGLILSSTAGPTPTVTPGGAPQIPPQVGPIRSGRLIYAYIGGSFQSSCLIYASAASEVLAKLPRCSFAFGNDSGAGSMMDITRLEAIAEENARKSGPFNYANTKFTEEPPEGGIPASEVKVFYSLLNQSGWVYDPLYEAWLRYVDNADKNNPGVLHADTDRLTGRQLYFENLIVLFADHEVVSSTNLDIHLDQGESGDALLFRDGQRFKIRWSTRSGEYEQRTGLRRPIAFLDENGNPALLKPGRTWILVVTPFSTVREGSPGIWQVRFYAPAGAK